MKRTILLLLGLILFQNFTTICFGQLKVDAEFRPRFEYRDGVKQLLSEDQAPAFVMSQRSRINMNYNDEKLELCLSFQDVRIYGDEVYKTDNPVLNVYQAYAGYWFNPNLLLRFGRQELRYDNKRLLGPRNWNNVGASHDLALMHFTKNNLTLDLGFAYNNDSDKKYESNYPYKYYKYLTFLWLNGKWSDNIETSLMNIIDGNQEEDSDDVIHSRITSGIYSSINSSDGNFGTDAAFYYQYGKSKEGLNVAAYYISIIPYYKATDNFKITAGFEYFSGDDALNDNDKENTFDKLYGDGHGPYGHMDYFTEIPKHTKNGGLRDMYLTLQFKPKPTTDFILSVHDFALTNDIIDTISVPGVVQAADKHLGVEIDFQIKQKLHKSVTFYIGYSTMLAQKSMEILKGGDSDKYQHWAWCGFLFKPTLFKQD